MAVLQRLIKTARNSRIYNRKHFPPQINGSRGVDAVWIFTPRVISRIFIQSKYCLTLW